MVFSTNQNRQFYVATQGLTGNTFPKKPNSDNKLGTVKGYKNEGEGVAYFKQLGHGGVVKSDFIGLDTVTWANLTAPEDMAIKLKTATLTLKSGTSPISGQDYIVRINFRQLYGTSDEDIYQKYGAVHAYAGMEAPDFYKELAYSLVKNFSRVYSPLLTISFVGGDTIARATKINGVTKFYNENGVEISAGSPTGIVITEADQTAEWRRDVGQYIPVYFEVIPTTVTDADGNEVIWGTVTKGEAETTIPNGYQIAQLEYFCMGERGDQYRKMMWPKDIETKYLVDETKEYYVLDIHYAYQGTCEDIQKSEKTITVVSTNKAVLTTLCTELGITPKEKSSDTSDENP